MNVTSSRSQNRIGLRTHVVLIAAVAAMFVSVWAITTAAAQSTGRVTGVVINGTTDQPVSGVDVTLSRFEQVGPESVDISTTTDDSGRFEFNDLDTAQGFAYAVSTRYSRVLYSSGMILLSQVAEQDVEIRVYEPTRDESVIEVLARGIVLSDVNQDDGTFTLTDLNVISNDSARTFVGDDDGRALRFHIPGNAVQVTPRPGFDFSSSMIEDATLFTTSPVRPGTVNATVDYTMPYTGSLARFPIQSSYPVDVVRILVPADDSFGDVRVTTSGYGLTDEGVVDIDGSRYRVWTASGLAAGQTLTVTMANLPETLVVHSELRTRGPALIALVAVVMASGVTGIVVVRRGLHRPRPIVLPATVAGPLDERRAALSAQLRELEDAWEEGVIDESDYRHARRTILEDLRQISRQYRGIGDDE